MNETPHFSVISNEPVLCKRKNESLFESAVGAFDRMISDMFVWSRDEAGRESKGLFFTVFFHVQANRKKHCGWWNNTHQRWRRLLLPCLASQMLLEPCEVVECNGYRWHIVLLLFLLRRVLNCLLPDALPCWLQLAGEVWRHNFKILLLYSFFFLEVDVLEV